MNLGFILLIFGAILASLVFLPVFVSADQTMDVSQMASLLNSLQELVQNLAKKVQDAVPIVFASSQQTDINKDGIVDNKDWVYMKDKWFSSDAAADVNGDGIVNSIDFGLVNRNWNKTTQ